MINELIHFIRSAATSAEVHTKKCNPVKLNNWCKIWKKIVQK